MKLLSAKAAILFLVLATAEAPLIGRGDSEFSPGKMWPDAEGHHIQAHGGGILRHNGAWFWYGEGRAPGGTGFVACYTSTNLTDWTPLGAVLSRDEVKKTCGPSAFVERPKVIFNPRSGKFVMWMHVERPGYHYARAGVAVSDTFAGPFAFLKAIRPVAFDFGAGAGDPNEQQEFGGTFRDMNLFMDDDGRAYVLYSSENNRTMYVARLNADFTGPETPAVEGKTWARILARRLREGPAPFKFNGKYYLITSGCTGWTPNAADCAVAENILGPWKSLGNPCAGPKAGVTFGAQSTAVLAAPNHPGWFIFMADRWYPRDLPNSTYVWLPFKVGASDAITIEWRDKWKFNDLN